MTECVERLSKIIRKNSQYETFYATEYKSFVINGYVDCIYGNNVYEFKCVTEIDKVYFL
jgi:hypothetical protein